MAGRPSSLWSPLSLTPNDDTQPQIVWRVAEGATKQEVVAQLVINPGTVAYHLRSVFVKLGISSRSELIRLQSG